VGDLGVIIVGIFILGFLYLIGVFIIWKKASTYSNRYLKPLGWAYHISMAISIVVGFAYYIPYKAILFGNLIYFLFWAILCSDKTIQKRVWLIVMFLIPFYIINIIGFNYWDRKFVKDDEFFKTLAKREFSAYLLSQHKDKYMDKNGTRCHQELFQEDFNTTYKKVSDYLDKHKTYLTITRDRQKELPFISHEYIKATITYPIINTTDTNLSDYQNKDDDEKVTIKPPFIEFQNSYKINQRYETLLKPFDENGRCYAR
jgi:hypothetical protein